MSLRSFFLVLALLVALASLTALRIGAPELFDADAVSSDYMIFHLVGELAAVGRVSEAYDPVSFKAFLQASTGSAVFMTWTYPPHFNLPLQALAPLGAGWGYLVFMLASLALFVAALFRLGREAAIWAIALSLPAMVMSLLTGQNGLLTAGLMALFASLALAPVSARAGLVLGLLTYKPHLGLGLGLAALLRGGWRMVTVASLTALGLALLAALVYGADVWIAFLEGVKTSGTLLQAGEYKFARMVTPFTLLASLGLETSVAMLAHLAWVFISFGALTYACLKGWRMAHVISLAILAGTTLSPYAYDYDLCVLAPALALSYPALQGLTQGWRIALGAAVLLASGYGLVTALFAGWLGDGFGLVSLGGIGLLTTALICFYAMVKSEVAQQQNA